MKQKIKLWILQIEGWERSAVYKDTKSIFKPKLLPIHKYGYQSIEKAWNNQFPDFKAILQTCKFSERIKKRLLYRKTPYRS